MQGMQALGFHGPLVLTIQLGLLPLEPMMSNQWIQEESFRDFHELLTNQNPVWGSRAGPASFNDISRIEKR